jgi:hypothetical protein
MNRDLGLSHKAAFVLGHKTREAMAAEPKGRPLGDEGKQAAVDGACPDWAEEYSSRLHRAEVRLVSVSDAAKLGAIPGDGLASTPRQSLTGTKQEHIMTTNSPGGRVVPNGSEVPAGE